MIEVLRRVSLTPQCSGPRARAARHASADRER